MEEITMERIISDFNGLLRDLDKIIANRDFDAAIAAFETLEALAYDGSVVQDAELQKNGNGRNATYKLSGTYSEKINELLTKLSTKIERDLQVNELRTELQTVSKEYATKINEETLHHEELETQLANKNAEIDEIANRIRQEFVLGNMSNEEILKWMLNSYEYVEGKRTVGEEIVSVNEKEEKNLEESKRRNDAYSNRTRRKSVHINQKKVDLRAEQIALLDSFLQADFEREEIQEQLEYSDIALEDLRGQLSQEREVVKSLITERESASKEGRVEVLDLKDKIAIVSNRMLRAENFVNQMLERRITRQQILEYYRAGETETKVEIKNLERALVEVKREFGAIVVDRSSKDDLLTQRDEAIKNGDTAKQIEIAEKLRKNISQLKSKEYDAALKELGFLGEAGKITSIEQANKFQEQFANGLINTIYEGLQSIRTAYNDQKENLSIFEKEIRMIEAEQKASEYSSQRDAERAATKEKNIRKMQIVASMSGNNKVTEQWNDTVKRFVSHRAKTQGKFKYVDKDGREQEIDVPYETIKTDKYKEYDKDADFLNLHQYKKNLELVSIYKNSNGNRDLLKSLLDKNELDMYLAKEQQEKGAGDKWLDKLMQEKSEYVSTYNGFTNDMTVKHETLKTAGSTLKAMLPVRGDLPVPQKIGNGISNTLRFFGIRKPEFTKTDENGNKVSNKLGGALTLGVDAAVIGGLAVTAVLTGPVGLSVWGAGYAAKGIVTAANVAAAKQVYKNHKDEIDANLPLLQEPNKNEKEVARRAYYREEEGKNRVSAWFKAKVDKYFNPERAEATEKNIVDKAIAEMEVSVDERVGTIEENEVSNRDVAERNNRERIARFRETLISSPIFNYVVDNLETLENDTKHNDEFLADVAKSAAIANKHKNLEQIQDFAQPNKDTTAIPAVSIDQKYKAAQESRDRKNRVWTMVLTAGMKVGIDAIRGRFCDKVTEMHQEPDQVVPLKTTKREPVYVEQTQTRVPDGSISDMRWSDTGVANVYGANPVNMGSKGDLDINAIVLTTKDANGNTIEVSLAEAGSSFDTTHVHELTNTDLSNLSIIDALKELSKGDSVNFTRFLSAKGLDPNNISWEELAKMAVEAGEFKGSTSVGSAWRTLTTDNIQTVTRRVLDHYKDVPQTDMLTIPGMVTTTTRNVINGSEIVASTLEGAAAGAGIALIDGAHDTMQTLAKEAQEEANKNRARVQENKDQGIEK